MGLGSNLYTGTAAWGKVQGFLSLCCCALLGCVLSVYGVVATDSGKWKDEPEGTKRAITIGACLVGLCLACLGVVMFIATQKSKRFAAAAGIADIVTWGW